MKKLLSLPPNLVEFFYDIEKADRDEWFCTSDPIGSKLGSGGGTAWLLEACKQHIAPDKDFLEWLREEKRILLHAGGQSRRLPLLFVCRRICSYRLLPSYLSLIYPPL